MTGASRVVIDTGPALSFIAAGFQDLLAEVIAQKSALLCAPQAVAEEVHVKADQRQRFNSSHARIFDAMTRNGKISILPDSIEDPQLAEATNDVAKMPIAKRLLTSKDLGETMVLAHALKIRRHSTQTVIVLIDEVEGQKRATQLGISLTSTVGILKQSAQLGLVSDRGEMRNTYSKIAEFDDGLPHWDTRFVSVLRDRGIYRQRPC